MLRKAAAFLCSAMLLLRAAHSFAPGLQQTAAKRLLAVAATTAGATAHSGSKDTAVPAFEVVDERPAYEGWRRIVHRDVRLPSGHVVTYDIMKQDEPSVLVFTWFTDTKTTTLIKELAPGRMTFDSGVVAGICELKSNKHASTLEAAKYELEEEAHLTGGTWISLLRRDGAAADVAAAVNADKYSTSQSYAYLVLDPVPEAAPRPLDAEEFIEIERGVSAQEALRRVLAGEMNVVSGYTCLLALQRLREMGLLADGE